MKKAIILGTGIFIGALALAATVVCVMDFLGVLGDKFGIANRIRPVIQKIKGECECGCSEGGVDVAMSGDDWTTAVE